MIDTQAIRNKILDLAMRGKLTEQLPGDGTAEELYEQIQAEKQELIKAGRIKKEKPMSDIPPEDVPFPLPNSWKWVYLGELFQHNTGKALNARDRQGQILDYITTSNLYWDHFELDELKQMPFTEAEIEKCTVKKGDLLVCEGGDIGRSAIWPFDYDMRIQNHIHRLRRYSSSICTEFYYYVLWFYKQTGRIKGIGIGLQGFSSKRVHSLVVPFTPYKEADRIVEKIRKAFSILDTIDSLQTQYADNLTALKAKLIDAAIQGKLTEQLPEDGTAEELYRQIQAEKQALIKAGKIKKEKPLPEITVDEIPFEIPENWKWCRLLDLCKSVSDGDHQAPPQVKEGIPFLVISNVSKGFIDLTDVRHVPFDYYNSLSYERTAEQGDVLFTVTGSFGIPVIVDTGEKFCFQRHMALLKPLIDTAYLHHALQSGYVQKKCDDIAIGTAQRTVGIKQLRIIPIPLPPLEEQRRISERLERLFSTLEQ